MGFGDRDVAGGCNSMLDDIFVRALYLEHDSERCLILSFDLCFLGRADADRIKGAVGARLDLAPRQILLNASHSHTSPAVGTWGFHHYLAPDCLYLDELCNATVRCAGQAMERARPARIEGAMGRSIIPMSRRSFSAEGVMQNRPNPHGVVCDALPVCRVTGDDGHIIALLFSVAAHPSICGGFAISAEYPGVAMRHLDEHLGAEAAMFLQGCGGDAKTLLAGENRDTWRSDDWSIVQHVGRTIADEVIGTLKQPMVAIEPKIACFLLEMHLPLLDSPSPDALLAEADQASSVAHLIAEKRMRALWARRMLESLERGKPLPRAAPVLLQGISLGMSLRIVAIEGEPVAEHGLTILSAFRTGTTFPLGYSNGEALYLPCDRQLPEGGYEVTSFWEYGFPSGLTPGIDAILAGSLTQLKQRGVH